MLRDVLAARWRMFMPRKGAALMLGFILSQLTLASSPSAPQPVPQLVLWPHSESASSVNDQSHHLTEGRLRYFARSWTNRHIKFRSAKRDPGPGSNLEFASVPSGASPEESTVKEKSSPAMTMLELDPFNSYARAVSLRLDSCSSNDFGIIVGVKPLRCQRLGFLTPGLYLRHVHSWPARR